METRKSAPAKNAWKRAMNMALIEEGEPGRGSIAGAMRSRRVNNGGFSRSSRDLPLPLKETGVGS